MDCFIQYTARLRQSRTRRGSVQGHYIAFRQIEQEWYRFDDAVVHKVDLNRSYSVNLVIYRRHDMPAYICPASLANVKLLQRAVPLNRKPPGKANNSSDEPSSSKKPNLITPDSSNSGAPAAHGSKLKPEAPTRSQPTRANKAYVVYYSIGSESSSDENVEDRTHTDSEYVQPKSKGMCMQCKIGVSQSNVLVKWSEVNVMVKLCTEYFKVDMKAFKNYSFSLQFALHVTVHTRHENPTLCVAGAISRYTTTN